MTILVVEDSESLQHVWRHWLDPIGAELRFATTMQDALRLMMKLPKPDLVLLDLVLPDSTQEETGRKIARIKEINENCIVMVVSGMMDPDLREKSTIWGADDFIHKHDIECQENLLKSVQNTIKRTIPKTREAPYESSLRLLETISGLLLRPRT